MKVLCTFAWYIHIIWVHIHGTCIHVIFMILYVYVTCMYHIDWMWLVINDYLYILYAYRFVCYFVCYWRSMIKMCCLFQPQLSCIMYNLCKIKIFIFYHTFLPFSDEDVYRVILQICNLSFCLRLNCMLTSENAFLLVTATAIVLLFCFWILTFLWKLY